MTVDFAKFSVQRMQIQLNTTLDARNSEALGKAFGQDWKGGEYADEIYGIGDKFYNAVAVLSLLKDKIYFFSAVPRKSGQFGVTA